MTEQEIADWRISIMVRGARGEVYHHRTGQMQRLANMTILIGAVTAMFHPYGFYVMGAAIVGAIHVLIRTIKFNIQLNKLSAELQELEKHE